MNKKDLLSLRRFLSEEKIPEDHPASIPDYCQGFNDALRTVEEFLTNYFHGQE